MRCCCVTIFWYMIVTVNFLSGLANKWLIFSTFGLGEEDSLSPYPGDPESIKPDCYISVLTLLGLRKKVLLIFKSISWKISNLQYCLFMGATQWHADHRFRGWAKSSQVHLLCKECIVHRKLWFVCTSALWSICNMYPIR